MYTNGSGIKFTQELLSDNHIDIIENYDCGNEYLNFFLKKKALSDLESKTYLFLDENKKILLGYYSIQCSSIKWTPDKKVIKNLPAIEIKYFSISKLVQKLSCLDSSEDIFNFSDLLFCEVLKKCNSLSEQIGVSYIILYSTAEAFKFYERNTFENFSEFMQKDNHKEIDNCIPMMMEF